MFRFQKGQQLLSGIGFQCYPVTDVGTVETGNKLARMLQRQPLDKSYNAESRKNPDAMAFFIDFAAGV